MTMYTIGYARQTAQGFEVKLRNHPTDELKVSTPARLQVLPEAALDNSSIDLLEAYCVACEGFDRYDETKESNGSKGYYSLQVTGPVKLGPLTETVINGRPVRWYEGFQHGHLTLSRFGNAALPSGFDPNLGVAAPEAAPRRRGALAE